MQDFSLPLTQELVAQIDQAMGHHELWFKNIMRTLISRLPPDPSDLHPQAHQCCRFGQWYESPVVQGCRTDPAFVAIGLAHQKMHEAAAQLLQQSAAGSPIPAQEVDQFSQLLERMRLAVQSYRRELTEAFQNRDPLTGALNRTAMLSDLREQQALVLRGAQQCVLAMIDLDRFKQINDDHGHVAGDEVLIATVQCLRGTLRPYDRLYRYGGEEFLLCMPQTSLETGAKVAERLRGGIAANRLNHDGHILQLTASFGLCALASEASVEEAIDRADKAMYQAKAAGRNRVVIWGGSPGAAPGYFEVPRS